MQEKYFDYNAGAYVPKYPILRFSESVTDESRLRKLLVKHPRFLYAENHRREKIEKKFNALLTALPLVLGKIKNINTTFNIQHISIGGSYLFNDKVTNDVDFNVVVDGSFFSYVDDPDISEINDILETPVQKISFMFFGEDDFLRDTGVVDTIETDDFLHTSLLFREGLIFPIRNVLVYGRDIVDLSIDEENLLIRFRRQLYHAELIIQRKVYLDRSRQQNLLKAAGRISEALFNLTYLFPRAGFLPRDILKLELKILEEPNEFEILALLHQVKDLIDVIEKSR